MSRLGLGSLSGSFESCTSAATNSRLHTQHGRREMTVLVTGSSGLIGAALRSFLGGCGHHVRRLRRAVSTSDASTSWNPADGTFTAGAFDGSTRSSIWPARALPAVDGRQPARLGSREPASPAPASCARNWQDSTHRRRCWWAASAIGFYGDGVARSSTSRRRREAGFLPRYVTRGRLRSRRLASEACGSCICVSGLSSAAGRSPRTNAEAIQARGPVGFSARGTST